MRSRALLVDCPTTLETLTVLSRESKMALAFQLKMGFRLTGWISRRASRSFDIHEAYNLELDSLEPVVDDNKCLIAKEALPTMNITPHVLVRLITNCRQMRFARGGIYCRYTWISLPTSSAGEIVLAYTEHDTYLLLKASRVFCSLEAILPRFFADSFQNVRIPKQCTTAESNSVWS